VRVEAWFAIAAAFSRVPPFLRYAVMPYVNGGLFSGSLEVPRFSRMARSYLLHIGALDWTKINPDIFGSMIQAAAEDEERGALGLHYTSVPNILKVLNPLFLDDLRARLEEAGSNSRMLLNMRRRMSRIRVFDPASGSGNFLVIAYKEMRAIEAEIDKRRGEAGRRSEIPLTNFRGIELRDFPAEIPRLALIIAEYQCDVLYRGQKEARIEFLPLKAENWITCGNALRLDWLSICPPSGTGVKHHADDLRTARPALCRRPPRGAAARPRPENGRSPGRRAASPGSSGIPAGGSAPAGPTAPSSGRLGGRAADNAGRRHRRRAGARGRLDWTQFAPTITARQSAGSSDRLSVAQMASREAIHSLPSWSRLPPWAATSTALTLVFA
jgi:hypothetical protein